MEQARNISHSEVTAWLSCRRKYDFAFVQTLEPAEEPAHLTRGNDGHEAFQRYAEARIDGKSHDAAMTYAEGVFVKRLGLPGADIALTLQTKSLFEKYMGFHKGWPEWKILGTEEKITMKVTDQINMVIRYDILIEEIASGKRACGDYKFTYDFWKNIEHEINAQMPKYLIVLNANGYNLDYGFLEEIRTRTIAKARANDPRERWKRTRYIPREEKKRQALQQHISASLEIIEYRNMPRGQQMIKAIPVFDRYNVCKSCPFKDPCATMFDGGDPSVMLSMQFKENTYNYNKLDRELL